MNKKDINFADKFLVAGSKVIVGSAICRALKEKGYGNRKYSGEIFSPTRRELDYLDYVKTAEWFKKNKPSVVIIAAAKVGGIMANSSFPTEFLLENLNYLTQIK